MKISGIEVTIEDNKSIKFTSHEKYGTILTINDEYNGCVVCPPHMQPCWIGRERPFEPWAKLVAGAVKDVMELKGSEEAVLRDILLAILPSSI